MSAITNVPKTDLYAPVNLRFEGIQIKPTKSPDDGKHLSYSALLPLMHKMENIFRVSKDEAAKKEAKNFLQKLSQIVHHEATKLAGHVEDATRIVAQDPANKKIKTMFYRTESNIPNYINFDFDTTTESPTLKEVVWTDAPDKKGSKIFTIRV